jgi:hypothetical protein
MGKLQGLKQSELKKKTDSLHIELMKIDNELFELEKKYGEFNIRSTPPKLDDEKESEAEFKIDSL